MDGICRKSPKIVQISTLDIRPSENLRSCGDGYGKASFAGSVMALPDDLFLRSLVSVHQEQPKNQLDDISRFDFCRVKDVALGELAAVCIDVRG